MSNPVYLGEAGTQDGGGGESVATSTTGAPSGPEPTTAVDGTAEGGESSETSGETSSTTTERDSTSSGTTAEPGPDPMQRCPDDDALTVCLQFDVGSPADVADESPYLHPVNLEGGGLVASPWEFAFHFDPSVRLEVDCEDACGQGPTLTYEAWVRVESPPSSRAGILERGGLLAMYVTNTLEVRCSGSQGDVVGGVVPLGAWAHVACVTDGESLVAYVDGEPVAEAGARPTVGSGTAPLAVGNVAPAFNQPLTGDIDRARVWSMAFTPAQVAESAMP